MKTTIHKAETRGKVSFGWLKSNHSFSFGHYHNPERMSFGMLRVLNDDIVEGGAGFPAHPHNNMEIVSIPLAGSLAHKDSTGTEKAINTGEVQIMSAGSGITHSEYNHSKTDEVNFLQVWVIPKERNIDPRYDQKFFSSEERKNSSQTVVAPNDEKALWINQDAWFSLADIDQDKNVNYLLKKEGNGVYVFVIDGNIEIGGNLLGKRDAIGVSETDSIDISAKEDAKLLLIEVPMK